MFKKGNQYAKGNKPNKTSFKKDDIRLLDNTFAKGNKPNQTSFKKGEHKSLQTEFKKGEMREKQLGEKNSNWKGGITPILERARHTLEVSLWKKAVLQRDNFTCQKYGTKIGGTLRVHHINNFAEFPELQTSIENGITLSEKAHKEFHKKYGRKNNTKEQLEEFLSL